MKKLYMPSSGAIGRIAKVAKMFFTRLGALLLVFSILAGYIQYEKRGAITPFMLVCFGSSVVALMFAVVLAIFNKEGS